MDTRPQEPKRIWWIRPRKLCALERPGGGGRSHRSQRREAEIAYLAARGVRLVVSTAPTRHNLAAYEAAGLDWHHVPVERPEQGEEALEGLLVLLERRLKKAGAVAVHGNSHTDFVAAVGAAHLRATRGVDPVGALAEAVRAGLVISGEACALLGVSEADVEAALRAESRRRPRGPQASGREAIPRRS